MVSVALASWLAGCAPVGPEFVRPEAEIPPGWSEAVAGGLQASPINQPQWWRVFNDPILNRLVETAWQQNNSLEISGLRVLEARAQLGIAQGSKYPQSQLAAGSASFTSPAKSLGNGSSFWQFGIGASAAWEMDFWGRFSRGIEAADAAPRSARYRRPAAPRPTAGRSQDR